MNIKKKTCPQKYIIKVQIKNLEQIPGFVE